jgi:trans-2,3-dihydro-3-hydroxyanthranilate isomerase
MNCVEYHLVDVFSSRPFAGNQLAVFPQADAIPEAALQRIARELDISETTFVLPPIDRANDFRLRIFTPHKELPFAGHPTLGTAFVLAHAGYTRPHGPSLPIRLEEGVGVVTVEVEFEDGLSARVTMDQPLPSFGARIECRRAVAEMLGLAPSALMPEIPVQVVSNGAPLVFVPLRNLETIRAAELRVDRWRRLTEELDVNGVFIFTTETEDSRSTVHGRMFAPPLGITEDPATGAAAGSLGCYLLEYGLLEADDGWAAVRIEQGAEIGRPSLIDASLELSESEVVRVRVSGACVLVGEGKITAICAPHDAEVERTDPTQLNMSLG